MGKNFRGKNRRRDGGGGRGGGQQGNGGRDGGGRPGYTSYPAIAKNNEKLQEYYDGLLQLPEDEKKLFWDALKRELPNSFRFCGSKGHALTVKRLLQTRYIPEITKMEHWDGRQIDPPAPVPWYPDELAWWMTTPKNVVRKFPPFSAFQKFLVSETSVGNISRQEVVSMIPPLLMDLRPGMVVLDMCAAPGSKAAQLLEMIHVGEEARVRKVLRGFAKEDGLDLGSETQDEVEANVEADSSDHGRATGLLIANDSDYKRGHMLVHQLKRLSSPNLLVSNHDATQFPSIRLPPVPNSTKPTYLKFDRILADVPCSGDGTMRKNANLWKDWHAGNALGLHLTQVRILVRALQLLKVGGRVVYSTCSMNPVENESIIAAAIDRCGGSDNVEIVDCTDQLPGLKRYPGMKKWTIMDKSARIWDSWEAVETHAKENNDGVIPGRLTQTMFPKHEGTEGSDLPLDRCMRVYAHMQDTGGFFIAVLEKRAEFKAKNENETKQAAADAENEAKQAAVDAENGAQASTNDTTAEPTPAALQVGDVPVADAPAAANEPDATATHVANDTIDAKVNDAADADKPAEDSSNGTKRPLEADDAEEAAAKKLKTETAKPAPQLQPKPKRNGPVEEPFKYLDPSHHVIKSIKQFYGLSSRFPDDRYMVRNEMGEPAKAVYYTTALTRDILTENEGRGIKFIHGGVRMYMKQDAPSAEVCRWRIQSEGIPILQGYVGEARIVRIQSKETFHKLLIEMFPRISDDHWRNFAEMGERVRDIGMGCCVLRIEPDGSDPDFTERMALPLWKSIHSLNLMLPKEDRAAMLLRVYNDSSPLINITLQKQKETQKAKGVQASEATKAVEGAMEIEGDKAVEEKPAEAEAEKKEEAQETVPEPEAMEE